MKFSDIVDIGLPEEEPFLGESEIIIGFHFLLNPLYDLLSGKIVIR
jgi:hypothetical protein